GRGALRDDAARRAQRLRSGLRLRGRHVRRRRRAADPRRVRSLRRTRRHRAPRWHRCRRGRGEPRARRARPPIRVPRSYRSVGGSSRIPLVAEMISAEINRPIALDTHPKHAVALGAAITAAPKSEPVAAPTFIAPPAAPPPVTTPIAAAAPPPIPVAPYLTPS